MDDTEDKDALSCLDDVERMRIAADVEAMVSTHADKNRYVYLAVSGGSYAGYLNPVKIGVSDDPDARSKNFLTATPGGTTETVFVRGDEELEAALHNYFSSENTNGEWFRWCEGLEIALRVFRLRAAERQIAEVDTQPGQAQAQSEKAQGVRRVERKVKLNKCVLFNPAKRRLVNVHSRGRIDEVYRLCNAVLYTPHTAQNHKARLLRRQSYYGVSVDIHRAGVDPETSEIVSPTLEPLLLRDPQRRFGVIVREDTGEFFGGYTKLHSYMNRGTEAPYWMNNFDGAKKYGTLSETAKDMKTIRNMCIASNTVSTLGEERHTWETEEQFQQRVSKDERDRVQSFPHPDTVIAQNYDKFFE